MKKAIEFIEKIKNGKNLSFDESKSIFLSLMSGDLNDDFIINIQDVIILIGMIIGSYDPSDNQIINADLNQDTIIDILDIVLIINIILN